VVFETTQCFDDLVVALPIARSAADAAIDDKFFRMFGDIRIEIVHQHAESGFSQPTLRGALHASRRTNDARVIAAGIHVSSRNFGVLLALGARSHNAASEYPLPQK